jgi:acyl-CoA reductase-like NAD-dependent aldehyde dehydrogenase
MVAQAEPRTDPRWAWISEQVYPLLIDGALVGATGGAAFPSISPRDNRAIARIAQASAADVASAVAAARRAFDEGPWGRTTAKERGVHLLRIADLIEKHADELAFLE